MAKLSTAKDSRHFSREWFQKAEADIDFAKLGFRETEHYGQVCFLCQQAVEKYLKGFLVAHNIVPAKIHSTATLARKCSLVNKEFKRLINPCKVLDRHYIPPRYPVAVAVHYRKQDAEEALEIADSVIDLVISLV